MGSPSTPAALHLLEGLRNTAADAVLVDVLAVLPDGAQDWALDLLIDRAHTPSLVSLVGRFVHIPRVCQDRVLGRAGDLFGALRQAAASPVYDRRAGAIELVVRSHTVELAYLLSDALKGRCAKTRELAALGLYRMTAQWQASRDAHKPVDPSGTSGRHVGQSAAPGREEALLAQALRDGVMCWEIHHQPKLLHAAACMIDQVITTIVRKLEEPQTRIGCALDDMLIGATDPRLAGLAVRALAIPKLRGSAVRAIGGARDLAFIRAILAQGGLLADRDIRRGCRWIRDSRWLHEGMDVLLALDDREAATAMQFLAASGGSQERKLARYRELLDTDRDTLRKAVVQQLQTEESDAVGELLALAGSRGDDEVAALAERVLRGREAMRAPGTPMSSAQGTPPGITPSRRAFARLWNEHGRLAPEIQSGLVRTVGGDLAMLLRAKLASSNPPDRARALRLARAVGSVNGIAEQVYRLAHDPDALVRAAAIGCLVALPGLTGERILRGAVGDTDARVQADAIETIGRLNAQDRVRMARPLLDSPHNRVRANAIMLLLRNELPRAGEVLLDMLEDSSRAHRLSALWIVERMRLRTARRRVLEMSRHDPDEQVRARAARTAESLVEGAGADGAKTPSTLDSANDRSAVEVVS